MKISGLFCATKRAIGPKLQATGIYKSPVEQAEIDHLGIVGDIQADKRVHGGPEKALHQFSLLSYQKIIQRFPLLHKRACPGSIGENISAFGMDEDNLGIGDTYQVGTAILQVSAPRIPCWKIDAKFSQPGLSQFIAAHHLSGWYYRVVQSGRIHLGDNINLIENSKSSLTVRGLLRIIQMPQPDDYSRELVSHATGLDPDWRRRLLARV